MIKLPYWLSVLFFPALVACGGVDNGDLFPDAPDAGAELGSVEQGWTTRKSSTGGRTWGVRDDYGNTACAHTQSSSSNCYFHGHNGGDTLDMVVKYWVNPQWTDANDDLVRGIVDTFISNAQWAVGNGQADLPWSFQRLSGTTKPSAANVVIQAGYASGTLGTNVGQYVRFTPASTGCVTLNEPTSLPGTYHQCMVFGGAGTANSSIIAFDLDSLEAYMFQQGYSASQKETTRRHVLWHAMFAELGLGGHHNAQHSSTRMYFSKTDGINSFLTSEEICRWRRLTDAIANNGNPGDQTNFRLSSSTCS